MGYRLKEILNSNNSKLLLAIANNYGNLEQYDELIANGIRKYMTKEIRDYHYTLLNKNRVYYDAYMFKGYMPYKIRNYQDKDFRL